jgi:hypothetical protein
MWHRIILPFLLSFLAFPTSSNTWKKHQNSSKLFQTPFHHKTLFQQGFEHANYFTKILNKQANLVIMFPWKTRTSSIANKEKIFKKSLKTNMKFTRWNQQNHKWFAWFYLWLTYSITSTKITNIRLNVVTKYCICLLSPNKKVRVTLNESPRSNKMEHSYWSKAINCTQGL